MNAWPASGGGNPAARATLTLGPAHYQAHPDTTSGGPCTFTLHPPSALGLAHTLAVLRGQHDQITSQATP